MERLQELRQETQAKMRPWAGDFFNREQFSMPEGLSMVQNRLSNNLRYYQSNYLITVLLIFCYCVITHIFLAVVIAGMAVGFFYVSSLPQDYNTQVGGMLITKRTLNLALIIVGVFIFLFSGISSTFFWLVGISALIVGAHAASHEVSIESDFGGSGASGTIA